MKKAVKKGTAFVTVLAMSLMLAYSSGSATMLYAADTQQSGAPSGEAPSGGAPSDQGSNSSAPSDQGSNGEAPSGEAPSGENADAGSGESATGEFGGGANTTTYDYTGTYSGTLSADGTEETSDGETIESDTADVNTALAANAGILAITNGTLTKSGDDTDGDSCNFYGVNSVLLSVNEGSMAYISDSSLTADSEGSNAIFATDSGTVYANNVTINTSADNSRGLDATYGGTIIANLMDITTLGEHCASIATDRGGGSISVTNSTLSTSGSGSPLLYSTGDIEVNNVTGTATGSQIAGMEGLNTILIYNSDLTSTITSATASDPIANGIIIYQSTSGDAETTTGDTATFQAVNSTLTSSIESGAMFYVTNTSANVLLSGTTLNFDSDSANLMTVAGNDSNSWGTSGSNGGQVTFTLLGETVTGDIEVDTISSLDLYLLDGTTYTGVINITENADATEETESPAIVNISSDSTWVVTGNTTISALNAEEGATIVDESGNTVTIIANGQTVVEGTSEYTITVTGEYSNTVETDEDNEISTNYIDRTDFDSYYGTNTGFDTMSVETETAETTETSESGDAATDETSKKPLIVGAVVILAIILCGLAMMTGRRRK
ncbi:MAG: adhesin [Eubacterium sp.]|nr:adhesin [Eubacterium sp.]